MNIVLSLFSGSVITSIYVRYLCCRKSDCCTYIRPQRKGSFERSFYDFSFNKRWFWQCANVRYTAYAKFTFVILYIFSEIYLRWEMSQWASGLCIHTQPYICINNIKLYSTAYVYSLSPFEKGSRRRRRRAKNKHIKWNIDAEKHWQFKLKSYNIKDYRTKGGTNVQAIIEMRSFSPFFSVPLRSVKWNELNEANQTYIMYTYINRRVPFMRVCVCRVL